MNTPTPTPIIPADADPIAHVEAMILAYYAKNYPSRLRASNDEGPNAPAGAQRIAA